MTIRVVLVDDQVLVRAGFRMVLASQDDIEVVGEAGDGAEALRLLDRVAADVVVMDIRMPVMDGVAATRAITSSAHPAHPAHPARQDRGSRSENDDPVRVLVLTTFDTDEDAFAALRAGASGFLLKNAPPEELLAAIRIVAGGDSVVAPRVTRRLLEQFVTQRADPKLGDGRLESLTEREREVLTLIAQGMSNAEIAEHLYVAETTIKTHVGRILAKLSLRDRVQAVVFAYEAGLVRP